MPALTPTIAPRLGALGGSPDLHQPRAEVVALQDALTAVGYATASDRLYGNVIASLVRTFQCAAGLPATGAVDGAFELGTEAAVSALQRRAYLPETGIVDHTTLSALNDTLVAHGLAGATITGPPGGAGFTFPIELHFYPSDAERKLYVVKDGKVLDRFGMVGGQNRTVDDPNHPTID